MIALIFDIILAMFLLSIVCMTNRVSHELANRARAKTFILSLIVDYVSNFEMK